MHSRYLLLCAFGNVQRAWGTGQPPSENSIPDCPDELRFSWSNQAIHYITTVRLWWDPIHVREIPMGKGRRKALRDGFDRSSQMECCLPWPATWDTFCAEGISPYRTVMGHGAPRKPGGSKSARRGGGRPCDESRKGRENPAAGGFCSGIHGRERPGEVIGPAKRSIREMPIAMLAGKRNFPLPRVWTNLREKSANSLDALGESLWVSFPAACGVS